MYFVLVIDVSVIVEGLRIVGQLREEIFLILHSALQLHYLKVLGQKFDKKMDVTNISPQQLLRSTMHPSLKTSMVFREQLLMTGFKKKLITSKCKDIFLH